MLAKSLVQKGGSANSKGGNYLPYQYEPPMLSNSGMMMREKTVITGLHNGFLLSSCFAYYGQELFHYHNHSRADKPNEN